MRKFLLELVNVFLSISIFLLLFSFYGKVLFSGVVTNLLGELSTNIIDTSFSKNYNKDDDKVKVEKNITFEELFGSSKYKELLKDKEVQELIQKYVDSTIEGITDPDSIKNVDLSEDVINYIKENKEVLEKEYGIDISENEVDGLKEDEAFKNLTEDYINKVQIFSESLTKTQKNLIKAYNFLCGLTFKIIMIAIIIFNLLIIALLQKSLFKWINTLGINLLCSGLLTTVLGLIVYFSVKGIVSKMNLSLTSNFLQIVIVGGIATVIGILLIIIYFIIKKKSEDDGMEEIYNEVSKGFDEKFETFDELSPDDE